MSTHNANRFDSEHDAPEESVHLLRAELDACREEIDRLRGEVDFLRGFVKECRHSTGTDLLHRREIEVLQSVVLRIWPDVEQYRGDNALDGYFFDGVLSQDEVAAVRRIVGES